MTDRYEGAGMKIVFAGPTLHGIPLDRYASIQFRSPAKRGDIARAVGDGAAIIGLIDGVFELTPSVWHKEILWAMSRGVTMLGAASMGALRAAECHAFGMIGVGKVFEDYASGRTEDDEDVAQLHAPAELGYLPLSEPLVNIRATLAHLRDTGRLSEQEHGALRGAAEALFFKHRNYKRMLEDTDLPASRKAELAISLKSAAINVKQQDAKHLLDRIETEKITGNIDVHQLKWELAHTRSLHNLLQDMKVD
jgi:hypothetical protein